MNLLIIFYTMKNYFIAEYNREQLEKEARLFIKYFKTYKLQEGIMGYYKDKERNTWFVEVRYKDIYGNSKKKKKNKDFKNSVCVCYATS